MSDNDDKPEGSQNLVSILTGNSNHGDEDKFDRNDPGNLTMDKKVTRSSWPPKRIGLYAAGLIFAGFVAYQLLYGVSGSTLNVETEKITVASVSFGPFQEYIAEQGEVVPLTTIYLDAMEGGRVEEKFVEAGTPVVEGEPIIRLSNTNLQLNVMQREAELFEQANNLRSTRVLMEQRRLTLRTQLIDVNYEILQLERNYNRQKALLDEELISREVFEQARDDYQYAAERLAMMTETVRQDSLFQDAQISQLEASVNRLQANLLIIKQNEENLTLRSPLTGLLSSLNAEIGESKIRGERLGQIDVEEKFKATAQIDEHYIARINSGQKASFDFNGNAYSMAITKVFLEVVDGQFEADLEFIGDLPQGLRRGQTLQIRLELGDLTDAILIPRGGFYQKTGGQWIYVLDESGEVATKRAIRIGRATPRQFEVLEGLEPGERVITSMYDNFGDMDRLVLN
jgi:HlyD family secretion protein